MEGLALMIPIFGIIMPVLILAIIFGYQNYSEKRFHDSLHKLMESNQEISEEILSTIPGYKKVMPRDDVRSGFITLGTGIGLSFLGGVGFSGGFGDMLFGVGLLVACIGGAIFAYGYFNRNNSA